MTNEIRDNFINYKNDYHSIEQVRLHNLGFIKLRGYTSMTELKF